jgi:biotin synthase
MDKNQISEYLTTQNETKLTQLWEKADRLRKEYVGDGVHLRGLIEISNYCCRSCHYCGLRREHDKIQRYRMPDDEIIECALMAAEYGYGTVVIQAGEDFGITAARIAKIVENIKTQAPLAVTLSLGERGYDELRLWRDSGADRYLLRFETSDPDLYKKIHPQRGQTISDRIAIIRKLQELGYEAGSGVMIGIPGQTYETLANDVLLFKELDLDMVGVGPFIAHPDTPLGQTPMTDSPQQPRPTELMTYKMIALIRILCPEANIPSTTALATINKATGREFGLQRGANVVMPNMTPRKYRALYEIYPSKACIDETAQQCRHCLRGRIESIGRHIAAGPGSRIRQSRNLHVCI